MAESADVLTGSHQRVILPDLNAGCSMADMADIDQVEECWEGLASVTDVGKVVPVTYMNSSAALKAFVGEHGGAVCTSSNARAILEWALAKGGPGEIKVLFFPDQHLGRNTAYDMGYVEDAMRVWNPRFELGGLEERDLKESSFLLWKGHCSVHNRFTPDMVDRRRAQIPGVRVIVHPECRFEVAQKADAIASTEGILKAVRESPDGSKWAVGTELNMVNRMAREEAAEGKEVTSLDDCFCACSTMFRIDPPHLLWVLEGLLEGDLLRNPIRVPPETSRHARAALDRMLAIT
jgi:quinolinate synthase